MSKFASVSPPETPTSSGPARSRPIFPLQRSRPLHVPIDCGASTFPDQFSTGLPSPPISDHGGPTTPKRCLFSTSCTTTLPLASRIEPGELTSLTIHDPEEDDVFSPASLFLSSKQDDSFTDVQPSQLSDLLPFPLSPPKVHPDFKTKRVTNEKKATKSNRRYLSAEALTPPTTPDRYIGDRDAFHPPSKTFHLSKPSQKLTAAEKLFRQNSSTTDAFTSPSPARVRQGRRMIPLDGMNLNQVRPRGPNVTSALGFSRNVSTVQSRGASIGAVWSVGGNLASTSSPGPVQAISDGRGGMLGSGTNAPIYTSNFATGQSAELDHDRLEARIAVALDIDRTNRMLNTSRSPERGRTMRSDLVLAKRELPDKESRTKWINGEWVQESSSSREFNSQFQVMRYQWLANITKSATRKLRNADVRSVPTTPFR